MNKLITIDNLHRYNENIQTVIDFKVQKLMTDTELKFFCVEPVTVTIRGESTTYNSNTLVDIFLKTNDEFEIVPTSNKSIASLYAWPGALGTYYEWLEGVNLFDGVLFNMNNEDLYTKWSQGNQGLYHVQFAQYKNCIFWSDLGYISDVKKRTNYTLYYSSELPLCYSSIPDNTFKAFYFAYNVTCDPNWSNPAYKESFAKATWATQVFSYYGLHSIGIFDWDSPQFNIVLPKDCRGLMYYAPNVLNAGVFDAINTTNFGAKSGSWRDAFACCYQLNNLYIKNLKVNLNISWSPINQQSLNFILSKAANTNSITIYLSPHTYYGLTDANKQLATEKNITLTLISTNTAEDNRLQIIQTTGDGSKFLADDGTYKEVSVGGSSSGNGAYSEINHGTSDSTFELTPNTFHVWDEMTALTLTLGAETSGVANEYLFQFTSGTIPTTLTLPDDIKFSEDLVIEANKIYQISILKGLGSVLSWDNAPIICFTIETIGLQEFQAEQGMTWMEWIYSEYNTDGYKNDSTERVIGSTGTYYIYNVTVNDTIIPNNNYTIAVLSGGGGAD